MGFKIENGVLKKYIEEDGVTEVVIPDNVTSIGEWAFSRCESLKSIMIPDSVTSIGKWAFSCCKSLTDIMIPESVTSIGCGNFEDCYNLTNIKIPENITSIGTRAFFNCYSLTSITIPESVASIGGSAFSWCTSLTGITIPNSVTSIGDYTFYFCKSLTNITIPDGVTSIGQCAFFCCKSLTSIKIPESVKSIKEAFDNGVKITFTENGVNYTIKLEYGWDTKAEEKCLNNFVFEKDNSKRQKIFSKMKKSNYKVPLALFMMFTYDDEFFKAYVKESFTEAMEYIIDNNDISMLLKIFETGFLTKENISRHVNYAIDNTQKGGSLELQMILMRYKHDNFPDTGDKTKRFII